MERLDDKFKEIHDKIQLEESADAESKDVLMNYCGLQKRHYEVPEIEIPESVEESEEEYDD